ncbi:GYDIA family GHMP kinase [Tenacibaculum maritimum]|uniref:GYDIA family GHMP kinase n=1 Tax=Tenacibaculum maritimum TaxID=107401 RepID=UPI0012E485D9|nr:GYDIA family GHMP kinase [Tenacibaculum maritimum]CAA0166934.1 phosphomevalonate kinase [Tenacibaculum maritimum]
MEKYYSNGKLLLTGEYVILDGAKSLAVPTKLGQDLTVQAIKEKQLIWGSFTNTGICWFEAIFDLPKLRLISCTYQSDKEGSSELIAETLLNILQEAKKLNPSFLATENGFIIKTNLSFPQNWGLGSSSTLINNIAHWANINPFSLLRNSFSGSGYDIACAQHNTPIFYKLEAQKPIIDNVNFNPTFSEELFFIHLNKKQNSREGIAQYKKNKKDIKYEITTISNLSTAFVKANSSKDLSYVITEHEQIISGIIKLPPVKKNLFGDYFGAIKSLGAWGGDFILAIGNKDTPSYFQKKGFNTIIPYSNMVL